MILPDANLLLYAYDQSSPFHTIGNGGGPAPRPAPRVNVFLTLLDFMK
jgi:hypothetical protein